MTSQSRNTLKSYFETGDIPTQAQFANLIDTMALAGNNPYNTSATTDIVVYPGASATAPLPYAGSLPFFKAVATAESAASMGFYAKGRSSQVAGGLYFGVSGNYGRETMVYLETTAVLATCDRQLSFEPGFSSTSQFPSIRSEGIGTYATDPDIPLGYLTRKRGYHWIQWKHPYTSGDF